MAIFSGSELAPRAAVLEKAWQGLQVKISSTSAQGFAGTFSKDFPTRPDDFFFFFSLCYFTL